MLMDEMKIQENLVWDKHTGHLIGYVDFGEAESNYATLQTCDSASPNRKLFRMHFPMNPDTDVTYRTVNLFSSDKRFIYLISDVPHLMKTARNCLYNSGKNRYTRYMWKNGMFILWNYISDIFMKINSVVYTYSKNYQMNILG